ncbi:MAG: ankyrin repeat domain-containing protein [Maricaulaceae bacterium]
MDSIKDAISKNDLDEAHKLLSGGADWDLDGFMGRQAIDKIIRAEKFDLLADIFDKEIVSLDVFEYDRFDNTVFMEFLKPNPSDALIEFLESQISNVDNIDDDLQGKTWLGLAIEKKADPRVIECLINGGCDINRVDMKEQNYLFGVKDAATAESLINHGLDVNQKNIVGQTVLFGAVSSKNKELIQLLIDNGAEINVQDNKGETPYHIACFNLMDTEIFAQMAEYEPPRFDMRNKQDQSLMMQHCESSFMGESSTKMLALLIEHGGDLLEETVDGYGKAMTPADKIALKKCDVLQMVIGLDSFDASMIDNRGNNWLHKVCAENLNFDQMKAKEFYRKVKMLLKAGVDAGHKNDEDKSPIDLAQDDNLKSKGLEIMLKSTM